MISQPPSSPHQYPNNLNQIFSYELPSECNLYSSSKRCSQQQPEPGKLLGIGNTTASVPIMKFATERHSVAVMQDTNQLHEPNSYSLSTSRLPQSKSATKKKTTTNNKKDISNEPESSIVDTCLAHSSLVLGDCAASPAFKKFSVEIFAMMRTTEK